MAVFEVYSAVAWELLFGSKEFITVQNTSKHPDMDDPWTMSPSKDNEESVFRRHSSFFQELDPKLSQLWPSLLKTQSSFLFWKDEWIKHGSCAACVEGMNSPLRYFQICLKLRGRFDIDRALEDAGVKPSCNQSYPYDKVNHALAPVIGDDPDVQIQCINDEKGREVLVQVKIPLSQNLTLGCHHKEDQGAEPVPPQLWHTFPGHPCPQDSPVFYFPINHDHPHQPCD
uniref:ribonuclease T2-like isoform X2 n=1 Tax=Oncorhynchus gorbuscha TaxID=8017 RepID=UPI001EAEE95B|nr:ribonuclease T2-like isoform X2 [Oncorhynchus gorbuscha]XP_046170566.1 ribonuclease T2-like isoform X2 [Oncorhynchus gorbuscha]